MPDWRIPLSDLAYGYEEQEALRRVLERGWISLGPEVAEFEREFARYVGVRHAVAVASGTAALHLAFLATGVGLGSQVVQPALNFVSSANMTVAVGAEPVFADIAALCDPTVDPFDVARLITDRTKAIVVMHYGGVAGNVGALMDLCNERNLVLIEDACHALGARYGARAHAPDSMVGSASTVSCFSFFSNKNLATGEGGMLATNDDEVADRARLARSHGMTTMSWDRFSGHASSYDVIGVGFNYRMDDMRASLGRVQLGKLDGHNSQRRELRRRYIDLLGERGGWVVPFGHIDGNECAAHLMVVLAPSSDKRDQARECLAAAGIQTSLHYPCIVDFAAHRASVAGSLAITREFVKRALSVPLYPGMTAAHVDEVVKVLEDADRP